MNEGQSISFTSFDSYNYPSNNNLTFHQVEPTSSQYDLTKDSMIRHFPGKNLPMGPHIEIILLLQAAEIQRLTVSLHEYRLKFKRLVNNEKDFASFKNQADELLNVRDDLQFKNKRMYQYAQNQKGELMDKSKYLQILESKYKRSLKLLELAHISKQDAEMMNSQLKEQLMAVERTFQSFKKQSMRQYQELREEIQRSKNDELSFEVSKFASEKQRWGEILNREQNKFAVQKKNYEELLEQERNKNLIAISQIDRLKSQISDARYRAESFSINLKKELSEAENKALIFGSEIQRLNMLLKDKVTQLKEVEANADRININLSKSIEETQWLRKEQQRYKNKNSLYEEELNKQQSEITRLSSNVSTLTTKVNEMGLLVEQKNVEIRVKQSRIHQQIENRSQVLSKSEYAFNRQVQQYKIANLNLTREVQKLKHDMLTKEEVSHKKQSEFQAKTRSLEHEKQSLTHQLKRQQQKGRIAEQNWKSETSKLTNEMSTLKKDIEEIVSQKKSNQQQFRRQQQQFSENTKRLFQQKLKSTTHRYTQSESKVEKLRQNKQTLERQIFSLKLALEKSERNKQQIRRCHTFEQMINEIEQLCKSVLERDEVINKLRIETKNVANEVSESKKQIESLRQVIIKLINMNNANESSRRQDNYIILEQIKKMFLKHSIIIQEIKENTYSLSHNSQRQKEVFDSTQRQILQSKQSEISQLKERLHQLEIQSHGKGELKDIISRIIVITKQNTELKVENNKKGLEIEQLQKTFERFSQLKQSENQHSLQDIRQKEEICKKLFGQLQESHQILLEEKQNQKCIEQKVHQLQMVIDQKQSEIRIKERMMKEMENKLQQNNEHCREIQQKLDQQRRNNSKLKQEVCQIISIKSSLEFSLTEKEDQFNLFRRQVEGWEQQWQTLKLNESKTYEQSIKRLNSNNQQLLMQTSKLKNQISVLVADNSMLKEQTLKAGSSILSLTQQNQYLQQVELKFREMQANCQNQADQINELVPYYKQYDLLRQQVEKIKKDNEYYKKEQQKNQQALINYSEKIELLSNQFKRLEAIIEDLKNKNSQLMSSNYELTLSIQKFKISQHKIIVLSEEIDRLQIERMNLIEEINVCRLEISQDCTLDRQIKENHILLVILFAEIQSLRERLSTKESEVQQLRRLFLPK